MAADKGTVGDLFNLAISAEKAAEMFYRGLETKFADHEELVKFWKRFAAEEVGHAAWLERFRQSLTEEKLAEPADPSTLRSARAALRIPVETLLLQVENLEDTYQLVNELESSETNTVFEFLIAHFARDENTQSFLRAQLQDHSSRIIDGLPVSYRGRARRLAVKARK